MGTTLYKGTKRYRKRDITLLTATAMLIVAFVVCAIIFWEEFYAFFESVIEGSVDLKEYILGLGSKGVLYLFVIIGTLFFTPFLPSVPFQLAAGIAYGPWWATIIIGCAIGTASQIFYLFAKNVRMLTKSPKKLLARQQLEEKISRSNRSIVAVLLLAYFVPGIPFLLIATVGAVSGIKYYKYLLFTFFGPWLEILFTVALGNAVTKVSPVATMVLFAGVVVLIILSLIFKDRIVDFVFAPKLTIEQQIRKPAKRPNRILYNIVYRIVNCFVIPKYNVHFVNKQLIQQYKKPFVVIGNHCSRLDFLYTAKACMPHRLNFVVGNDEFYDSKTRWILKKMGAIPKYLYTTDITCTKNILRIARQQGNIAIYPEGIRSTTGTSKIVNPAIAKLLRQIGYAVFVVNIKGGYNTFPKFSKTMNKGRIDVEVSQLFDESIASTSTDSIYSKICDSIRYDENDWTDANKVEFQTTADGLAVGLHNLLYKCVKCGKEFAMTSHGDHLTCTNCGYDTIVNPYIQLDNDSEYKTIPQWWQYQEQSCNKIIMDSNGSELMADNCELYAFDETKYRGDALTHVGHGRVCLTQQHFVFEGVCNGEPLKFEIDTANIPSLTFAAGRFIQIYHNAKFYHFALNKPEQSAKWAIMAEQIFLINGAKWSK